ncbi:hypothetical protein QBZ16_002316 [Prototheca wickerhamii]|uniref:J domain-containing protein n=1 Tax=Prototheca wickerhamii TaxID=3111 RepID=A0AAD9MNZ2_PROWI|nr:hypothetical protein QBZ16_002316 [Prototheca wickerhamii]
MEGPSDHTGSTPMFAIFVLSLYSLYLIPYTIYKLCGGSLENVSKPWEDKSSKTSSIVPRIKKLLRNPLVIQWTIYILFFWYTSSRAGSVQQFDPFQILQVAPSAGDAEIKKAYRRLSLQYHPDKNPDPRAADYFANFISKAYQALMDEASRANYEKYGHPDGPQAFTVSVALPEWFFSKDKNTAPLILLLLLFGGIVAPVLLATRYLTKRDKFTGPNQLLHETIMIFAHDPRIGIKESQSLARIPDTVVCAMEFITLPCPPSQGQALDELRRRVLSLYPDLKAKSAFWKRRPGVVKAHMLLLAHLERAPVPAGLARDNLFVIPKLIPLLREMTGIACAPRVQPGHGWLSPAVGAVEMMQHVVRAVPVDARRGGKNAGEAVAALLQLPGVRGDALRALGRAKVRSLAELRAAAGGAEAALRAAGLEPEEAARAGTALAAAPRLAASFEAFDEMGDAVRADNGVLSGEVVTDEVWYFLVGDAPSNAAMALTYATLSAAEACGAATVAVAATRDEAFNLATFDPLAAVDAGGRAEGAEADDSAAAAAALPAPQEVSLAFRAPLKPGRYQLSLHCMCDSWIGSDRTLTLKLKVVQPTRAQLEGRAARTSKAAAAAAAAAEDSWEEVGSSDAESDGSDEDNKEYDSDEYGTEESSSDEE